MTNKQNIDFAQNVNALGEPKGFGALVSNNSDLLLNYPDPKNKDINSSLVKFLGVKENSVAYINGSTEAFFRLPTFLKKPKSLIIQPTFWEYEVANKKAGRKIETFLLNETSKFELDFGKLDKKITNDTVIYLCNPNNPTSTLFIKNEFLRIIQKYKNADFVVDETYLIFRQDYEKLTLVKYAQRLKNLYVVSSLSKIFALPGIRAGFLVSHPKNVADYMETKTPYDSSPLSGAITKWAVKQNEYLQETRDYYELARKDFADLLERELDGKLLIFKPQANFILAKILTNQTSTAVTKLLAKRGILIRDGAELPHLNNKWIRFTINKQSYNKKLVINLKNILS